MTRYKLNFDTITVHEDMPHAEMLLTTYSQITTRVNKCSKSIMHSFKLALLFAIASSVSADINWKAANSPYRISSAIYETRAVTIEANTEV